MLFLLHETHVWGRFRVTRCLLHAEPAGFGQRMTRRKVVLKWPSGPPREPTTRSRGRGGGLRPSGALEAPRTCTTPDLHKQSPAKPCKPAMGRLLASSSSLEQHRTLYVSRGPAAQTLPSNTHSDERTSPGAWRLRAEHRPLLLGFPCPLCRLLCRLLCRCGCSILVTSRKWSRAADTKEKDWRMG